MNSIQVQSLIRGLLSKYNLTFDVKIGDIGSLGLCETFYPPKQHGDRLLQGVITINRHHVLSSKEEEINESCRHEVAHAVRDIVYKNIPFEQVKVYGKMRRNGHDSKWREIAIELGAKPKACADFTLPKKFIIKCSECGWTITRDKSIIKCIKCGARNVVQYNKDYVKQSSVSTEETL